MEFCTATLWDNRAAKQEVQEVFPEEEKKKIT
jgi:hypothetical protein